MNLLELLQQAEAVQADLDELSRRLEHGALRPELKSAMARDIYESRVRIQAVVQACTPVSRALAV